MIVQLIYSYNMQCDINRAAPTDTHTNYDVRQCHRYRRYVSFRCVIRADIRSINSVNRHFRGPYETESYIRQSTEKTIGLLPAPFHDLHIE